MKINVGRLKFKEESFRPVRDNYLKFIIIFFSPEKKTKMYASNYIKFTF